MIQSEDLSRYPEEPGVYLMRDAAGTILYIGKAVHIRNRLRSHFINGHAPQQLYQQVSTIDFIVTKNELEALLLEISLIKENLPKYNVQLKDDKRYPYLKLTLNERFPRLFLTRTLPKKGEFKRSRTGGAPRFFGPFPHVHEARVLLQNLQEVLPVRTCKIPSEELRLDRPCLQFEMHRCLAPCVESICSEGEYREMSLKVLKFLDGDHKSIKEELERRMQKSAEELSFEKAAIYRDALKALEVFRQRQTVSLIEEDSEDYLTCARVGNVTCVVCIRRRRGNIRGSEHYFLDAEPETEISEILAAFIVQHYESAPEVPRRVLCSELPASSETLESWLTSLIAKKVEVRKPHRGPRVRLLDLAIKNAEFYAAERYRKSHGGKRRIDEGVLRLGVDLGLSPLPVRIEGYDISHHRGEEPVASMVVFENGVPRKSDYRKFRIRTAVGGDDFRSMEEVITRRFSHREDETFGAPPDLVLIDGGPVQLEFARQALESVASRQEEPLRSRLLSQQMVSLAKREEEIYLVGQKEPVRLDERNPGLLLLQQTRDESHRFAIGFHRKRKAADMKTSALAAIPGIGPSRLEKLLIRFGSLEKIAETPVQDLCALPGITQEVAEEVVKVCRKMTEDPKESRKDSRD